MATFTIVSVQFFLMVSSVVLNAFGVYCLRRRKRRRGNVNQLLLQQNLAMAEIFKMIFDLAPLTLYYFYYEIYVKVSMFFVLAEVYIMTVLHCSFFMVTLERLLCVLFENRYSSRVKYNYVVKGLMLVWIASLVPCATIYAVVDSLIDTKVLYYITCDALVLGIICFTYPVVVSYLRKGENHGRRKGRTLILAILLTISFVCFNLIPDVIISIQRNRISIWVSSLLWSMGYVADPLVYVFAAKNTRKHAYRAFKVIYRMLGKWKDETFVETNQVPEIAV